MGRKPKFSGSLIKKFYQSYQKMKKNRLIPIFLLCANAVFAQTPTAPEVYNTALEAYRKKEFATALVTAQQAVQLKPTPESCYLVALCHKKLGSDATTLRKAYQSVLDIAPNHTETLTQFGIFCFNNKAFAEAVGYLERAQTQQPTDKTIQDFLAKANEANEKTKQGENLNFADEKGQTAQKTKKQTVQKRTASESSETIETVERVKSAEPRGYIKSYNEGVNHLNDGEFEQAVTAFRDAIDYSPNNPNAHSRLAWAYANIKGESRNAEKYLAKAEKLDPENPKIWEDAGDTHYILQNLETALKCYKKAQKFGMNTARLYQQMALVCYNNNQEEDAAEYFRQATVLAPNDAAIYYNMGTALLVIKKWHKGIEALQKAVALDDSHLEARFNMSRAYYQLLQYEKALAIAKESIAVDADFARGYFAAGKAYRGLGDSKNSQKFLDMAYRLDPKLKMFDF
jgi:tetratricopeptide (TPR) repeat protein